MPHFKQLGVIISAQILCVAVGLLMHHQFVGLSAKSVMQEQAWSDMVTHTEQLLPKLASVSDAPKDADDHGLDHTSALLADVRALHVQALLVDAQWRVTATSDQKTHDDAIDPLIGKPLTWKPLEGTSGEPAAALRGSIELADGAHFAVARPVNHGSGYLIVHRAVAEVDAPATALMQSMPTLSGITLLWMGALLAVVDYLVLAGMREKANRQRTDAATTSLRQTENLVRTRDAVIFGLAKLADSRDPETGDHLERIALHSATLAAALRHHPKFGREVTPTFVKLIRTSSALHDIGKVGIEDGILRKAGQLTRAERARMQFHTTIGGDCLREIEQRLGSSNFLQMARAIAIAHHERWDGAGYPNGLKGEEIPLAARIVAIVDVYDALASKRVYKPPFPHEECVAIIRSQAGKHFDPDLVDVWLSIESEFREVNDRFTDSCPSTGRSVPDVEASESERGTSAHQEALPAMIDAL